MTHSEKIFIRDWQIQREGPRWKYYLQYIVAWGTVIFLSAFFITSLLVPGRGTGGWISFMIVLGSSILFAAIITHLVYEANEKKYKRILDREEHGN